MPLTPSRAAAVSAPVDMERFEKPSNFGIQPPTPGVLRKYGLTLDDWKAILARSRGRCEACGREPSVKYNKRGPTKRLVIDHEHTPGFKKMKPKDRARFVRGLICWTCNHYRLARGATVQNLRGAADYLERYEARLNHAEPAGGSSCPLDKR